MFDLGQPVVLHWGFALESRCNKSVFEDRQCCFGVFLYSHQHLFMLMTLKINK